MNVNSSKSMYMKSIWSSGGIWMHMETYECNWANMTVFESIW